MKKVILTMASALFIGLATLNAQQRDRLPKAGDEPSSDYRRSQSGGDASQADPTHRDQALSEDHSTYSVQWADEDRESVKSEDLPQELVETLEQDEYQGWENATIYRNKTSNEYMLVMREGSEVKTFYFDSEGKALEDYSGTASGTSESPDMSTQSMGEDRNPKVSTDTTGNPTSESGTGSSAQSSEIQTTQPDQSSTQWRNEDRVVVTTDDMPSSLRLTLDDDQYDGWENSTLYRNRQTNEYMIEIRDGSNTKTYYFDKDGKPISNTSNKKGGN